MGSEARHAHVSPGHIHVSVAHHVHGKIAVFDVSKIVVLEQLVGNNRESAGNLREDLVVLAPHEHLYREQMRSGRGREGGIKGSSGRKSRHRCDFPVELDADARSRW